MRSAAPGRSARSQKQRAAGGVGGWRVTLRGVWRRRNLVTTRQPGGPLGHSPRPRGGPFLCHLLPPTHPCHHHPPCLGRGGSFSMCLVALSCGSHFAPLCLLHEFPAPRRACNSSSQVLSTQDLAVLGTQGGLWMGPPLSAPLPVLIILQGAFHLRMRLDFTRRAHRGPRKPKS